MDKTKHPLQFTAQEFRHYVETGQWPQPNQDVAEILTKADLMNPKGPEPRPKIPPKEPAGIKDIRMMLTLSKLEWFPEFKFHSRRKWRFDFAIPSLMVGIEYEGLIAEKSGHTTLAGYTKDCTKYNEAAKDGWIVLRYTPLNYKDFATDLREILKIKNEI